MLRRRPHYLHQLAAFVRHNDSGELAETGMSNQCIRLEVGDCIAIVTMDRPPVIAQKRNPVFKGR